MYSYIPRGNSVNEIYNVSAKDSSKLIKNWET